MYHSRVTDGRALARSHLRPARPAPCGPACPATGSERGGLPGGRRRPANGQLGRSPHNRGAHVQVRKKAPRLHGQRLQAQSGVADRAVQVLQQAGGGRGAVR